MNTEPIHPPPFGRGLLGSKVKTMKVELNEEAAKAIQDVQRYLKREKGLKADYSDVFVASLKMALRMGPGMHGIWWELREMMEERARNEKEVVD